MTSTVTMMELLVHPYCNGNEQLADATGLITNDPIFERMQDVQTIVLDRIL